MLRYATEHRSFVHIDSPGRRPWLKNAARAQGIVDALILVVSAPDGVQAQTHEQLLLAQALGLRQLVVFLAKCDLVQDAEWLDMVEHDVRELLARCGHDGDATRIVRGAALPVCAGESPWDASIADLIEALETELVVPQLRAALDGFVGEVRAVAPHATGFPVIYFDSSRSTFRGLLRSSLLALAVVTLVPQLLDPGAAGKLLYPVIAINDAETKWDFDNVYGTGQSSLDGILRATSVLLAGKVFVVGGYGHCGRGLASRARGMGARVICTEVKATQALKAVLEGFEVMPMDEAAKLGDVFCTATGMKDILVKRHFETMKDGAIVCNTGHYDCEINLTDLAGLAKGRREVRANNEEFTLRDGRKIYVLAQGRLVNLAAAEGHPSEVMDMSFANQFLGLLRLTREGRQLKNQVYDMPKEQDEELASRKLRTMGMAMDKLTEEQILYRDDYSAGT